MANEAQRPPRVLFLWEMSAGHRANYRRAKPFYEARSDIDARVEPVHYWDTDGIFERIGLGSLSARFRPTVEYRRLLREENWDAVYTSSSGIRGNIRALRRFPVVLDGDATGAQIEKMPEYDMGRRGPTWLREWGERRRLRAATRLSAWSAWAKEGFVAGGADADRVAVNPPGVDLDLWTPAVDDPPRATDDRLRVVFVGGDFDRKGGNDLLAWFRSNTDPRYELHLVTPEDVDPEPGVTVHRLSEADPEMQEFVRRAHVFVLPSRAECFGLATLEALASGVPVVQSTVGGAADIVTPGVTGALVRAGSTDEIGRALAEVFEDPDRYDQMRLAARADAVERFSIARNVDATVALIHEAIAAHAAEER